MFMNLKRRRGLGFNIPSKHAKVDNTIDKVSQGLKDIQIDETENTGKNCRKLILSEYGISNPKKTKYDEFENINIEIDVQMKNFNILPEIKSTFNDNVVTNIPRTTDKPILYLMPPMPEANGYNETTEINEDMMD
ncbi:hypothetical protein A3Q56_04623 [Intoshia linei]|uniref:Uncharacterized protein n=1 Tax=Intoshia linei TaxID=1819745 RepID=A0A177B214_9BILA|nr:hypothetical protein A3Q56_04623 [Intoshia linei]